MTAKVIELLRKSEASLFPAADSGALVTLLQRARADLGLEPPADYMAFLRHSDGAVANGLMLYGSTEHRVEDLDVPALIDINLSRRAYRDDLADLLQLGEIDDDIVGFSNHDQLYWRIDRLSGDCQEKAADLQELLSRTLAAA
jgi:hypothetical protein